MDEVLPRLFLGGLHDTELETLKENNIRNVLTVMDVKLQLRSEEVHYEWVMAFDMPGQRLKLHFPKIVDVIINGLEKGNMLVHCQVGMSRSVTAIISYMVAVLELTVEQSLWIIREQRPWACPNTGFMEQLKEWEVVVKSGNWDATKNINKHLIICSTPIDEETLRARSDKFKEAAEFHHKLISELAVEKQKKYASADEALKARILQKVKERESCSNVPSEELQQTSSAFKCKKCRKVLFCSDNLEAHQQCTNISANYRHKGVDASNKECTSYFLDSDLAWLPKSEGVVSGKLNCDKCSAKLGSYCWACTQCSCGAWIAPAFQIHKSKVDKVPNNLPNTISDFELLNLN